MRVDLGQWRRADLVQRRQMGSTYRLSLQLGMIANPSLITSMGFLQILWRAGAENWGSMASSEKWAMS
jgi:hypothetical protein